MPTQSPPPSVTAPRDRQPGQALQITGSDRKRGRGLAPWLALLALTGCAGPDPDAPFARYLDRLGRALAERAASPTTTALPRPPRAGNLQLHVPEGNLGALDFLALRGCAVQLTIARRNSSLGRLAPPSQRLLLDLDYLRLAPDCVDALREGGRDALAGELEQAHEAKRRQLPARIFNATLGSEEYRAFWRTSRRPGGYPAVGEGSASAALAAIEAHAARWLAGDYRADGEAFELALGQVAGGEGGALLAALVAQRDWLERADALLERRLDRGPLCGPGIRHRDAEILPNVVRRFFIEGIQPRAALLNRSYYALVPPIAALESLLAEVVPDDYRRWMRARDDLFEAAGAAPRQHVEQIKRILAPCTHRPGLL